MENQQPTQNNTRKKIVLLSLVATIVCVALVCIYLVNQSGITTKTTPPEYKRVSAITSSDILVNIRTDSAGMYFEHNGEKLTPTNRIQGLAVETHYNLSVTNTTTTKQGLYIPFTKDNVILNPSQSASISLTFTNTGTYYFLGNTYQPGWSGLQSGFDVGI